MKHFPPGGIKTTFCWFLRGGQPSRVGFMSLFYSFLSRFPLFLRQWTRSFPRLLFPGVPPPPVLGVKSWVWVCEGAFCPCGLPESCSLPGGGRGRGQGGKKAWPQPRSQQLETCKILAHHRVHVHVLGPKRFNQGRKCPGVHIKSILWSVSI